MSKSSRWMKRLIAVGLACAGPASAADRLIDVDTAGCQNNVAINGAIGQSFKLGSQSSLDSIDVWIRPNLYYYTTYRVELYDGEGGGTLLGSSSQFTLGCQQTNAGCGTAATADWRTFSFAGQNLTLQPNRAYTFKLVRLSQYSGAFSQCGNVYGSGIEYWLGYSADSGHDVSFHLNGTVVAVDTDGDGLIDTADNCPSVPNADQKNNDNDAQGDVCDSDDDNDGVADTSDNCAMLANADQADADGDGLGDVCDNRLINVDTAGCQTNVAINDAIAQSFKTSRTSNLEGFDIWIRPELYYNTSYRVDLYAGEGGGTFLGSSSQLNLGCQQTNAGCNTAAVADWRTFSFAGQNLTLQPNTAYTFKLVKLSQYSGAFSQCGNVYADGIEYWLGYSADSYHDVSFRLLGKAADTDADGVIDDVDNCPSVPNADQKNNDNDAQGDVCDGDDDNDGVADASDNCAMLANADQADVDGDGLGDVCDPTLVSVDTAGCQTNVAINDAIGQSFRVGSQASLDTIDIWIRPELYYNTSYRVDLYAGEGGGTFLGSSSQLNLGCLQTNAGCGTAAVADWRTFGFAGQNITLQPNTAYTFKLVKLSQYSGAFAQCSNVYAGGIEYWLGYSADSSRDMAFRVSGAPVP